MNFTVNPTYAAAATLSPVAHIPSPHTLPPKVIFGLAVSLPVAFILVVIMAVVQCVLKRHRRKLEAQEAKDIEAARKIRIASVHLSAPLDQPQRARQEFRRVTSTPPIRPYEARLAARDASFDSTAVESGEASPPPVPLRPVQTYNHELKKTIYWG